MIIIIEIKIKKYEEIDVEAIAEFTFSVLQSSDTTRKDDRTLETLRKYVKAIGEYPYIFLIAYQDAQIVGWLGIFLEYPTMAVINTWCPYIHQIADEDEIANMLISSGIEYVENTGRVKVEIFLMELTEKTMSRYERYSKWYERSGMIRDNEWAYMVCDLKSYIPKTIELPSGYTMIPLSQRTNDEIYPSYYASFITGNDPRFQEQTDQQRRSFFDDMFDRSKEMIEESSLLLIHNKEIVGHLRVTASGKDCYINGIGIHPEHRRKGLGRIIMGTSLHNAAKLGVESMILEVDVDNKTAIGLYEKVGFVKTKGSISHIWHKQQEGI
ncbi:MAG: GNAT family N-acetyltransferase [Candidatus Thorarchaeota archaeon]